MTDKKRSTVDWEDVRFFTALARHGTLAATARSLKVTHATVARRLASFEAALGRPVFTRGASMQMKAEPSWCGSNSAAPGRP